MTAFIDLTGQRYGRLVVIELCNYKSAGGRVQWVCKCDCGNTLVVTRAHLRSGETTSCGCLRLELLKTRSIKHGMHGTRIYNIHRKIKERCTRPGTTKYAEYGGRGITIVEEWLDFSNFHEWAKLNGYEEHLTIERINNDGPYSPENCKWATVDEQNKNRRNTKKYTINGETKLVPGWAEYYEINKQLLYYRIKKGESIEEAINNLLAKKCLTNK